MPDVFQTYNTTVNAGVTVANPTVALSVGAGIWQVVKVSVVIPAGHAGLTGIQLWYGGGAVIPFNSGWFSGDDDVIPLELSDAFPPGVPWSVAMINSDVIAHAFQTRWEMNYIQSATFATPNVNVQDVYAAADSGGVAA